MRLRTLLVDDSKEFLEALTGFLKGWESIEVVGTAQSAEDALLIWDQLHPDLVLMDILMPGMGGLQGAKLMRAQVPPPEVILITIYDTEEYRQKALELGVQAIIPKPHLVEGLTTVLKGLLAKKEKEMEKKAYTSRIVLIVDDSKTMRKMVRASLEAAGFKEFKEAQNGLEAIEKLALGRVDLMILDLNMPDMNGMEVIQFIRSHPTYSDLPILVLTTKGDQSSKAMALSAGADLYMTKPFDPQLLGREALSLLGKERGK